MNFNFYDNSKMNNIIPYKTAKLMMDMALFTAIHTYKSLGYDTEYVISKSDEIEEDVKRYFMTFCGLHDIHIIED